MRLWSTRPKPSERASSRARWRARTMSSSTAISNRSGSSVIVVHQAPQQAQAFLGIECRANTAQFESELYQRDRHRWLDADDHCRSAKQPHLGRRVVQETAQKRVDRLHRGEVEQNA